MESLGREIGNLIEQTLEIGLCLKTEALGRLTASLAQALPAAGGELLVENIADQFAPRRWVRGNFTIEKSFSWHYQLVGPAFARRLLAS